MAIVLAILGSGRTRGYTAGLYEAAIAGAQSLRGVSVERVHLRQHKLAPCSSCFSCIRRPGSGCVLDDDMGRFGKGALYQHVLSANGILLADAVHMWGPTAYTHLFFERLYPTLWTGELNGLPFAPISCASNQGMQHLAQEELCKWARGQGMRFAGGLAAHVVAYEEARQQAHELGKTLAVAALEDERGRRRFESEEERFLAYATEPFDLARAYLENLTQGTMEVEESLPLLGLSNGAFEPGTPAAAQAREAQSALALALTAYRDGDKSTCLRQLAKASSHWTSATWLAFLQDKVVGASKPPAYKPLPAADS